MRRREPWYLFAGDDAFAEQALLQELARCTEPAEQASLLHLLAQLGCFAGVDAQLATRPVLLEQADARAALMRLRQEQGHPNPWLALLPPAEQPSFLAFCRQLTHSDQPIEVRLAGGLGDQLEALALIAPLHQKGPLQNRLSLALPATSQRALAPLLAQAQAGAATPLPPHHFLNANSDTTPHEHPWLGLLPMRTLLAAEGLEQPPSVLFEHLRRSGPQQRLVVCWRSKVDPRERLWAHLRSLPFQELEALYSWLLPWAAAHGWTVIDITAYHPQEQTRLRRLPGSHRLDLAQPRLSSLADTAALVADARLVLSVDTALVHLAHAVNVPRWLLLHRHPDPRWRLRLQQDGGIDRESLRVLQQTIQGDWRTPLQQLRQSLNKMAI